MGLLDFLKRKPSSDEVLYALLYADIPLKRWPDFLGSAGDAPPEAHSRRLLAAAAAAGGDREGARATLRALADAPVVETRAKLLAWRGLRDLGEKPPADVSRVPRGVVCEVSLPHGLDVLACYEDRTARLRGAAGSVVLWEARAPDVDALIDGVLAQAPALADAVGPHGDLGLILPSGMAALTVLTYAGRHLRPEGLDKLRSGKSTLSPLFAAATQLFVALTQRTDRGAQG